MTRGKIQPLIRTSGRLGPKLSLHQTIIDEDNMQDHASIHEILLAFEQLTPAEKRALRDFARPRLDNTVYTEPDDLIHEALSRCLNGLRHWPKSVSFTLFFSNVIKS